MSMTIECSWQEFKNMAKEFNDSAPALNLGELDNAWKCLSLAFLGMKEPMWQSSADTLIGMASKIFADREAELM